MKKSLLVFCLLPLPALAAGPDFSALLAKVVFGGLIAAVLASAVLGVGYVVAKRGAESLVKFISRMAGGSGEVVQVGKHGYWDKEVYDEAMRDLNRHYRAGGIMDSESRSELAKWQLDHPDEVERKRRY